MIDQYRPYQIIRRTEEAPDVSTLWLIPKVGALPPFIAGQFVNIHVPALGSEAKSYTLVSAPHEDAWGVTIRAAGTFSRALLAHQVGDELLVSEPLGLFYPEDNTPRLFLAGGIGITPYISIIRDMVYKKDVVPTTLYYSNRTPQDAAFLPELTTQPIQLKHFVTRGRGTPETAVEGRIQREHLEAALGGQSEQNIFICGSIGFVRDMRLLLKELGVPEDRQFTESYF